MSKTWVLSAFFLFTLATLCLAAPSDTPKKTETDQWGNTPLHRAALEETTDIDAIESLLESGSDINARNKQGDTPLMLAATYNRTEAAKYLIFRGAAVNLKDEHGFAALHTANPEIGQLLIEAGADVNAKSKIHLTPLHLACRPRNADLNYIKYLIANGAEIDPMSEHGDTPLISAFDNKFGHDLSKPNPEVVRLLIMLGADVNVRNGTTSGMSMQRYRYWHVPLDKRRDFNQGYTPVHEVLWQMPELLPLCLEYGGNWDMTDDIGQSLIHYAAGSDAAALEFLIAHCGNIHAQDFLGRTPLHSAAAGPNENLRRLVELGADIHTANSDGNTPLHKAAGSSLENVKYLVQCGADIHAKNAKGHTPICLAAWHYTTHADILAYLHEQGADVSVTDDEGMTILHRVVTSNWGIECATFLLDKGVDVNAKNNDGETALHRAANRTQEKNMVDLLIKRGADVNAKNNRGQTPLHKAAMNKGYWKKVPFLLDQGADATVADVDGRTALHFSILCCSAIDQVERLLDAGLDMNLRDKAGKSLLHYAAMVRFSLDRQPLVKYFIDNGLDINAQDDAGDTPLHDVVKQQHYIEPGSDFFWAGNVPQAEATRELLQLGADPNLRNKAGKTPLDLAVDEECKEILKAAMEETQNE